MTATNILFITADDLGADTPGCFGGPAEVTPALDRLATEGAVFHRGHVPIAVCQPSRSAMLTGRWPHRNGAEGFEPISDGVPLLTDLLRPAGYRAGILGKVNHLQPESRFGWDFVRQQADLGMGRDPAMYGAATSAFIVAADERPWFLMANAHDPHRPFHGSDQERDQYTDDQRATIPAPSRVYAAADAPPPGFLPDLPETRREHAEYLSSSRRCDDVLAAVLNALEESGQTSRTLVVFLSDNGMAFPFAKANCYLQSTRTPMIVRWPGRVPPGTEITEPFVSGLDLLPTFCEAAGVAPPGGLDGRSLLPLLLNETHADAERDHIVTVFHETSRKNRYEMRCVQDHRYGYIWNAWSDGDTTYKAENMQGRTWPAMLDAATTDPALATRTNHYLTRTPEELYRLDIDPYGTHNLADDPAHQTSLQAARSRLHAWMLATGDPLASHYWPVATPADPGRTA
ncbi:sulfatase [Phytoactinopolyspora endophytica]|uniref:sulfatase family protein n=1 Tax=Phytoactinopolyspora endophytica TaxID=1642495 RepID=UPI00101D7736|nr:sulfatase [Phytoactinopolyspora endophytica]